MTFDESLVEVSGLLTHFQTPADLNPEMLSARDSSPAAYPVEEHLPPNMSVND